MAVLTANLGKTVVKFRLHQASPIFGGLHVSKRFEHGVIHRGQTSNLAAYKRGQGGRSSFSGHVVTVFGAYGSLGPIVVNKLANMGCQMVIPYRGDVKWVKELKVCGDLGQVVFLPFHLRDETAIMKAMEYSDTVINLIGKDYETRNFSYTDTNVIGARLIARCARQAGVERLVHVSHLNAAPDREPLCISEGSWYLRTKYFGEMAVREEFPDAIIIRPSDTYGPHDFYLNYYAQYWRRYHHSVGIPVWKRGTKTIKSPVYVGDVSKGITTAVFDPEMAGKVIEAVGEHSYRLDELVAFIYRCLHHDNCRIIPAHPWFRMKVAFLGKAWLIRPKLHPDFLEREAISDIPEGHTRLEDLGIKQQDMYNMFVYLLDQQRIDAAFYEEIGSEKPAVDPPPIYHWPTEGL